MKLLPRCHIYIPSSRESLQPAADWSDWFQWSRRAGRTGGYTLWPEWVTWAGARVGQVWFHFSSLKKPVGPHQAVYIETTEEEYQLMMKLLVSCLKSQIFPAAARFQFV